MMMLLSIYHIRYNNTDTNQVEMVSLESPFKAYSLRNFDKDASYIIEVFNRPLQYKGMHACSLFAHYRSKL